MIEAERRRKRLELRRRYWPLLQGRNGQQNRCGKPTQNQRIKTVSSSETLEIPIRTVCPTGPAGPPGPLFQKKTSVQVDTSHLPGLSRAWISHRCSPETLLGLTDHHVGLKRQLAGAVECAQHGSLPDPQPTFP